MNGRPRQEQVVIEAVVDDGADDHLRGRIELLDRVADEMRGRMPDDLDAFGILRRDDAQRRVVIDAIARVDELAVDRAGDGRLGETRADRCGDFGDGDRMVERLLAAVRERDVDHGEIPRGFLQAG